MEKISPRVDRWIAFLTRHDLLNKENFLLDLMNFASEEREAYEERLKWLRIEANTLKKYEAKGYTEGLEKAARGMLSKRMSIREVSEITGLTF